jgi:ketosteroid isomerase-like protein
MPTESLRADGESQIRALLDDRVAALHAKNASRLVSHYAPEVVKFDLAPPLLTGGPEVLDAAGWEPWFQTWQGPIALEVTQVTVTMADGVAFCHSLNRMQGTSTDGQKQDMWFRSTLGLVKIGDAWKITHEHNSTPFYMDGSGLAANDLRP